MIEEKRRPTHSGQEIRREKKEKKERNIAELYETSCVLLRIIEVNFILSTKDFSIDIILSINDMSIFTLKSLIFNV